MRNIEALKNEKVKRHITEYEIIADANLLGELTYGPYDFMIWDFSNKREGEERKLILRVREKEFSSEDRTWKSATREGFYHGGGIPDELVVLASLFLRRRFRLGPMIRMDDKPLMFSRKGQQFIDKPLVAGSSNLTELKDWFKFVESLENKHRQRFILAARLYHLALLLIEEHSDLAYLNLVSAIEALCQDTDIGKVTLADLQDQKLSQVVASIENEEVRYKVEQAILRRERFLKRQFVAFIIEYIEDTFWKEKTQTEEQKAVVGEFGCIKPQELPELLNRIYDQRSRTLHTGEPFLPLNPSPHAGEDIDFSLGITIGDKRWEPEDYLPYPHFFERLVNHVLKNFLKKNQKQEAK